MVTKPQELLFGLLSVMTGSRNSLDETYPESVWKEALTIASNQAIAGVVFDAIEKLPVEQLPSKTVVLNWFGAAHIIEKNTRAIENAGIKAVTFFRNHGFPCTILKGVSVGRYYTNPQRRASGDIDIWLKGSRKEIYDFARGFDNEGKLYGVNYYHVHFHLFDIFETEVHIWPSYLSSPRRNHLLHVFCEKYYPSLAEDKTPLAFDRVFILLHCYQHINGSGVGLRQIMDYYYVLKQGFSIAERKDSEYWIRSLGMKRFARGVMWILKKYFALDDDYLLFTPNQREGEFIMNEIMLTGNMGHYDTRNWGARNTPLGRFISNLKRSTFLVLHYPHEAIWQPFFSVWFYFWRIRKGLLNVN